MKEYEFKHLTEEKLEEYLNDAIFKCFKEEQVEIIDEKIERVYWLKSDYIELLEKFEEHIKEVIKANNRKY